MLKKTLSILFSVMFILSVIPLTVNAEKAGVPYQVPTFIDSKHPEKGMTWETKYCTDYTYLSDFFEDQYGTIVKITVPGWYVLDKDLSCRNLYVNVSDVNFILMDGKTLKLKSEEWKDGEKDPTLQVTGTFSVYGQEKNSGTINADARFCDGISSKKKGATINFYGGHIIAEGFVCGNYLSAGIGSVNDIVNIYGGNIEAKGGHGGPGIASMGSSDVSHLNIYGGTVYANGGDRGSSDLSGGPGIGGTARSACNGINIYGGDVTAIGGKDAAGIGGGPGTTSKIKIYGGKVSAKGDGAGSGIGVGREGNVDGVTIYGGTVIAEAGSSGTAIGARGAAQGTTVMRSFKNIKIYGGDITATSHDDGPGIGGDGSGIYIYDGNITAKGGSESAGIGAGYQGTVSDIHIEGGNITAIGGSKGSGIGSGFKGSVDGIYIAGGTINAQGSGEAAGIGGSYKSIIKNIYISGGNITAKGGDDAAGIGGGKNSTAELIKISGGDITAIGGSKGAGIGGGLEMDGSGITISGGTVNAQGGKEAAGIGGSYKHQGSNISIDGGNVTAIGGESAAGIGGGKEGEGNNISISGGIVFAQGGAEQGAGIGGGDKGVADNITISGGQVTARANNGSAGIGAGRDKNCGKIIITGGYIDAKGGYWAPGIGSGCNSGSGTADIQISNAVVLLHAVQGGGYPAIGLGPWSNSNAKCNILISGENTKVFNLDTMAEITDSQYGTSSLLITNGTINPCGISMKAVEIGESISKNDSDKIAELISKFNIKASGGLALMQSQMKLAQKILELTDDEVAEILADPNKHIDISINFEVTVYNADLSNNSNPYIDYAIKPVATATLYSVTTESDYSNANTIKTQSYILTPDDFAMVEDIKLEVTMPVPEGYVPTLVRHTGDGDVVYNEFSIDGSNCVYNTEEQTVTVYIDHCSHVVSYFESATEAPTSPQTGDNGLITLWIMLLAVSSFGIVLTIRGRKKKVR